MYTIYINNTLPPALAVHEIYRDIFGPPMLKQDNVSTFRKNMEAITVHITKNRIVLYFVVLMLDFTMNEQ